MNRRSFVKLSGLLVAGTASAGILCVASHGCGFRKNLHRVSKTRMVMGTFVTMTLMHTSQDEAEEAIDRAPFRAIRFSPVQAHLSDFAHRHEVLRHFRNLASR